MSLLMLAAFGRATDEQLPADDGVRIREFYRLAARIQDRIWPEWSKTPAPVLLVTAETEFLTHYSSPPAEFRKIEDDIYARPRKFSTSFLATFPAFGPPVVIVAGEPGNTTSKTSTRWLITLMHEHFHQLQDGKPGYFAAVEGLGLSHGDQTGMWMLNYEFPYERPEVAEGFGRLRDLLVETVNETDEHKFMALAKRYVEERRRFFAQLSGEDHKYFAFQLWQEGVARYTEIKVAEAAANYKPSADFAELPDFEPFGPYAERVRRETLTESRKSGSRKGKKVGGLPIRGGGRPAYGPAKSALEGPLF
jgi:hypothetical protein